MDDEQDLTAEIDDAWARFRARLADRLAELVTDEVFSVEFETGDGDVGERGGSAPYLQFVCWAEGELVRGEAVGNASLDERYSLTAAAEMRLAELGWQRPDEEELNFHLDVELREVDRLASISVASLREVYAVPHPLFLEADGLEIDPGAPAPAVPTPTSGVADDEPLAVLVSCRDELHGLVDAALSPMLDGVVLHDVDGDVAIRSGQSMLFVRVHEDRPEIALLAVLVREVEDTDRVATELDLLNRGQAFARVYLHGRDVHLVHDICAIPFAPRQLRAVVADLLLRIDDLASDLQRRVGGRRWLDASPVPDEGVDLDDAHPGVVALLELLHTGTVDTRVVAELLDHDRLEIIRQLVRIRRGEQDCDGHDEEVVLDHLRRALRYVVDGELPERGRPRRGSAGREHQLTLLSEGEIGADTLDLGLAN